ncbi:MAG TPA: hypothetical protein VKB92_08885 [Myxococcales bacterium]|nr:hypothetical protein [Myxococcales bacterium]
MRPPIFVVEVNGDITVHDSVGAAEGSVESVDVEDGEYRAAYDAAGRLLEFRVETPTKRRKWTLLPFVTEIELTPVRLIAAEPRPSHPSDFRAVLAAYLTWSGADVANDAPLDALVACAESLFARRDHLRGLLERLRAFTRAIRSAVARAMHRS